MNIRLISLLLLFFATLGLMASHTPVYRKVGIVYPIEYKKNNGKLKVRSYLLATVEKTSKVYIDGIAGNFQTTTRPDSLLVWLPLIGERTNLKVVSGKNTIVNQAVTPMIPSDWGYFQNGTIHLIQSSHQDIGWIDTPDYCRKERINDIIIPALDFMKVDKEFTFEMEQTLNLMEFLEEHPERKVEVMERYKEKRFNWGATFNQPYEGLESGEQLVRQVYYGRKWIMDNLPGCDDRTAANVDVPGRTWQLPQIFAKSGIENLLVSRMREGLYNWYAPDGSKLFTFTPGNYGWASLFWKFFDEDAVTAFQRLHHRSVLWSNYFRARKIPPHYAILMSCDATKPKNFIPLITEWNKIVEMAEVSLPKLVNSTAESYFNCVNKPEALMERVVGDRPNLWLYIHGSAHYQAIKAKREAAILLPSAETLTTLWGVMNNKLSDYPQSYFDRGWMASIYPDHGWGGKNGAITDSIFADSLMTARDIGERILNKSLHNLIDNINVPAKSIVVYNDLTWSRQDVAYIDISSPDKNWIVKNISGKPVPSQIIENNGTYKLAFLSDVPALGYNTYSISEVKKQNSIPQELQLNHFENSFYITTLGNGGLLSLYDKELNKELLECSKYKGGDIIDVGYNGNGAGEFTDVVNVNIYDLTTSSTYESQWKIVESGNLFTTYENRVPAKHCTYVQRIRFHNLIKKIDFLITLEDFDGAHNRQFRMMLPLNMNERTIHYEVPFGVLELGKDEMQDAPGGWAWDGTYSNSPAKIHPREVQNFISISGNGFGVTLSSCVAAFDWIDPAREVAQYPVLQPILLSSHKSCHGEGNWYHQKGTHKFEFSLTSHVSGWQKGYKHGQSANHPFQTNIKNNKGGILPPSKGLVSIDNPLVQLSLIKKADVDNNIIIRLTEMAGVDSKVRVTFPFVVKRVVKTNLIEQEIEDLKLSGQTIELPIGHHAIETFKLFVE